MEIKTMEIKISEIKEILKIFLKRANSIGIEKIDLDTDFYWNIDSEDKFNTKDNPKLDVGSLYDDYTSLQLLIEREEPLTAVDIERIGNILIYISDYSSKNGLLWL